MLKLVQDFLQGIGYVEWESWDWLNYSDSRTEDTEVLARCVARLRYLQNDDNTSPRSRFIVIHDDKIPSTRQLLEQASVGPFGLIITSTRPKLRGNHFCSEQNGTVYDHRDYNAWS